MRIDIQDKNNLIVKDRYGIVKMRTEVDERIAPVIRDLLEYAYREGFKAGAEKVKRRYLL